MEVQILVTAQIDVDDGTPDFADGDPGEHRMRESVREAVANALELVEGAGFSHDMASIASVGIVDCEVFTPNASLDRPAASAGTVEGVVRCPVCGSPTFVDTHTPASDHPELSTDRHQCETCDWHSDEWPTPNNQAQL